MKPEVERTIIDVCVGSGARLRVNTEVLLAAVGLTGVVVFAVVALEPVPPRIGASTVAVG